MSEQEISMVYGDFRMIAWLRVLLLIYISAFWNNPNAAPSTRERPKLWKLRAMLNAVTTVSSGSCPTASTPFWFLTMWSEAGCGTGACMTYICATRCHHVIRLSLADRPAGLTAVVERSDARPEQVYKLLTFKEGWNKWSNWDISCRGIIVPDR